MESALIFETSKVLSDSNIKSRINSLKKLPILLVISLIFSNLEEPNNKYDIVITESKVTEIFCIADDFCKRI